MGEGWPYLILILGGHKDNIPLLLDQWEHSGFRGRRASVKADIEVHVGDTADAGYDGAPTADKTDQH